MVRLNKKTTTIIKNIFFCVFIAIIIRCSTDPTLPSREIINHLKINKNEWVNDSIGCDKYRVNNVEKILTCKKYLIGTKFNYIKENFIGRENVLKIISEKEIIYYYFVSCKYAPSLKNDGELDKVVKRNDVEELSIYVNENGIVEEVNLMVP